MQRAEAIRVDCPEQSMDRWGRAWKGQDIQNQEKVQATGKQRIFGQASSAQDSRGKSTTELTTPPNIPKSHVYQSIPNERIKSSHLITSTISWGPDLDQASRALPSSWPAKPLPRVPEPPPRASTASAAARPSRPHPGRPGGSGTPYGLSFRKNAKPGNWLLERMSGYVGSLVVKEFKIPTVNCWGFAKSSNRYCIYSSTFAGQSKNKTIFQ